MMRIEIGGDGPPDDSGSWLMIRRYRRHPVYDYYVTASRSLEARLPQPLPSGGLGFAT